MQMAFTKAELKAREKARIAAKRKAAADSGDIFNPDKYSCWLTGMRATPFRESQSKPSRSPYKFNF